MHFTSFISLPLLSLWVGLGLAMPAPPPTRTKSVEDNTYVARDTCADPSLTQITFQSVRTDTFVHCMNYHHAFTSANSVLRTLKYTDQQPAFRGWPTQQPATVPLFQLGTADHKQYIYRIGADARTPPTVSGFATDVYLVAWVYATQVCGSVPLYSVLLPSVNDRFTTANPFERNTLITVNGWVDDGVLAYVLPV